MEEKRRTIVGGRSRGNRLIVDFPRNIEILIKKAKVDDEFRRKLLDDPLKAAGSIELELSDQEIKILKNVPASMLQTIIDNTPVPSQHIEAFRNARKAAVLVLLLGTTAVVPPLAAAGQMEAPTFSIEQYDESRVRMASIQKALENYKTTRGRYLTTQEWEESINPLSEYLANSELYDPWNRKFHYADYKEGGEIVDYRLESTGLDIYSYLDNIPCPHDTEKHLFLEDPPIMIQYPVQDQSIKFKAQTELRAEHQNPRVLVNWYLDDKKIGQTSGAHTLDVKLQPGEHTLSLIDENDYTTSVSFTVSDRSY
ncbi:MAG: hypothetical protein JW852_01260 [Spirochaetales bacterium]|nr:hypothetical protein [Spirochaetales bacterium]